MVDLLIWDCCHESQMYRNGYCFLRIRCADYMNHLRPRETFPFGHLAWVVFFCLASFQVQDVYVFILWLELQILPRSSLVSVKD